MIDVLDISEAQGVIDFRRVAAAKVAPGVDRHFRGVLVKVTEGEHYKDPRRLEYLASAAAVGLRTGAYHFLHPDDELKSAADGLRLARRVWDAIGDTVPHFRVAIDLEGAALHLTSQNLLDRVFWARDGIRSFFGRNPTLYTYPDFYDRRLASAFDVSQELADTVPLHWASYGDGYPWYPKPSQVPRVRGLWKKITLWQYSGNTKKRSGAWNGLVDGIAWDVDRNVFLGTEEEFADFCGGVGGAGEPFAKIVHAMPATLPREIDTDTD